MHNVNFCCDHLKSSSEISVSSQMSITVTDIALVDVMCLTGILIVAFTVTFWKIDTSFSKQSQHHTCSLEIYKAGSNSRISLPKSIKISMKFVPKGPINNIPALVQIMAWRRPGDEPLSEPMMVSILTHICVTRPQWVKPHIDYYNNVTSMHEILCITYGYIGPIKVSQSSGCRG